MSKIIRNFNAGPATVYPEVIKEIAEEFRDYKGMGYSLVEDSHRNKTYINVHENAKALTKELLGLGEDYEVLLLGGGATLQFAMLAYNFLVSSGAEKTGYYFDTGSWAQAAMKSAKKIAKVAKLYDGAPENFCSLPVVQSVESPSDAAYVHITSNETIGGLQWKSFPASSNVPLVADMSSDILSRQFDASKFSFIYAGAQKNLGTAGVCVVVIKKSFLSTAQENLPPYLSYKVQADKESMLNTPPVFAVWVLERVLAHIKNLGGVAAVEQINEQKAQLLYGYMEESNGFYNCPVNVAYRSYMNVVFRLPNEALEAQFVEHAKAQGMVGLKGHRSVGGCRASIYNAMSVDGVQQLLDFMKKFKKENA